MPRAKNERGGRGGRRGRRGGGGRGRGVGKVTPKELFPPLDEPQNDIAIPGPSTRTYDEEHENVKKSSANTKKALKSLPVAMQRKFTDMKRAKEMERFLLPDAPPRKKSRKLSPVRQECRLQEGTPSTPPSPKLRHWQIRNQQNDEPPDIDLPTTPHHRDRESLNWDTPTRNQQNDEPPDIDLLTTPHHHDRESINCDTPTSTISLDSCVKVPGCSPLRVDWTTGDLKNQMSPSTKKVLKSLIEKKPKEKCNASKKSKLPSVTSVSSTSSLSLPLPLPKRKSTLPHTSLTSEQAPLPPKKRRYSTLPHTSPACNTSSTSEQSPFPPKKQRREIRGSDIFTKEAEDIFESWQAEIDGIDSDTEDEDDIPPPEPEPNYINLEAAAFVQEQLDPVAQQWLSREDAEADKTIQSLLPIDHLTFEWNSEPSTFKGKREEFCGTPGPTFTMTENLTELDVFLKFFDDDLLDLIVTETNKHAKMTLAKQSHALNSRACFWKDTDRGEIVIFLGILLLQGMAPFTVEKDYWKENGYLTLKYFKNLMTYNRFVLLKKFLHFTDNESPMEELTVDERKLRKIWPVLNHLNTKFSTLYLPGQDIAIDESLLKWHGRISFAQKISTKAAKVGIKSYELCESSSGYLWSFFVYTGKGHTHTEDQQATDDNNGEQTDIQDEQQQQPPNEPTDENRHACSSPPASTASASSLPPVPTNATAQIVQHLAKPLLNKGYTLIMDNFYNAPLLARYLKAQQTDCFGTLRLNREFVPESFKQTSKSEMRVGEVAQSFCRDIFVMMWRDTNIVSMISTYHEGDIGGKEKYGRYKYKPKIVLDYNMAMGGVDKKDQQLSAHKVERAKNMAWYKKVFRRLLNITVLNSYVIFKMQHPKMTQRAFRQALVDDMIEKFLPRNVDRPLQVHTTSLIPMPLAGGLLRPILIGNHFIGTGESRYKICVWCRQCRTKYICKQCRVSLCLEICFEEFHTVIR